MNDENLPTGNDRSTISAMKDQNTDQLNNTGKWGDDDHHQGENIHYFVRENANSINFEETINIMSEEDIH